MNQPYEASVSIQPLQTVARVNPMIFGHFIEFMFDCIDDGMWAQLMKNRGFEQPDNNSDGVSDPWQPVWQTDQFEFELDKAEHIGRKEVSQKIRNFNHYGGWCGIRQDGVTLRKKESYQFSLWLKGTANLPVTVLVHDLEGCEYVRKEFTTDSEWNKYEFSFPSSSETHTASVEIRLCDNGTIWVDQTSLVPLSAEHGIWPETLKYIKNLHPPVIRFPGGCFADCYHWEDGIGERDFRPCKANQHWGGWEDNSFGMDEYMEFCEAVGCEPMICINFGTGTPQEAANWVEYCNGSKDSTYGSLRAKNGHPEPYNIKYWDIGNETFGDWEAGHCDSAEYVERYLQFYHTMAEKDDQICFMACAGDGNFLSQDWNQTLLKNLKGKMQVLCLHMYSPHLHSEIHSNDAIYYGVTASPEKYAKILEATKQTLLESGSKNDEIHLGVTEWNTSYFNDACREHTLEAAIFNAGMLNLFLKNADILSICNFSDLVNGWPGGCIRSKDGDTFGTASYFVLKLYTEANPTETLFYHVTSPTFDTPEKIGHVEKLCDVPYLDAAAAKNANGDILIFATNRHLNSPASVQIDCGCSTEKAEVFTITANNTWQINSFEQEQLIPKQKTVSLKNNTLELAPHSINLIQISNIS